MSSPCPCDIAYYVKFLLRAESCRDYVAVFKRQNGESGNGMRGMMGTRGIKVGMRGISVSERGMRGMRAVRVRMRVMGGGNAGNQDDSL